MKKRIFSIFALTAMIAALMPVMPVSAATSINIGEYLEMGTYYGEPILWRCVDIDENGPLMLSDKIICLKPFDAYGDNTSGSHGRAYNNGYYRKQYGSNCWADSNMRSWLNSNAGAGNVTWLCGNPPDNAHVWNGYNDYADEAGFKTNFTSGELGAVKSVIQDSLLDRNEYSDMSPYGSTYHTYYYGISNVVQNAKTSAYRERIADEFFLLDVNQINAVYNNRNTLGDDYYIGRLSEGAVKNSEYSLDDSYIGNKWHFWLRSPDAGSSSGNSVRLVDSAGIVYFYYAFYGNYGVRPAFYLNLPSSSFTSGRGTLAAPYRVYGTGGSGSGTSSTSAGAPVINAVYAYDADDKINILNTAVNIEEDSVAEITISVDVDWKDNKAGKLYITQGTKKSIEMSGDKYTFKPGEALSPGKTVYILAVDENTGKSTSAVVKLKVNAKNSDEWNPSSGTSSLNFKLGQKVGFTIPDSVVFPFGGMEIGFGLDFIPITVEYESKNKINVAFGLDSSNVDETTGRFKGFSFADYKATLKSGMKKGAEGYASAKSNEKLVRELKSKYPDMKFDKVKFNVSKGMDMNTEITGYAEMTYADGGWHFSEGFLALNATVSYSYQGQVFIWVVPCYYEFGGEIGAGIEGTLKDIQINGFKPKLEGYITAKVGASIGGGIGVAKVCTLGAEGSGSLNLKTALHESYVKAWGEGDADFKVKVLGKTVASKNFAHGEFTIYETGNSKALIKDKNAITLQSVDEAPMYGEIDIDSVYENESRAYAKSPSEWLGEEPQLSASADYTNKNLRKLAENIYTDSAPQVCELDDKKVMVMQWDNPARADADRTMLVYSVYNEESDAWSAPEPVYDDGTADFYPDFRDGWLVWQNEKTELNDEMTLKGISELGEICAAKWNGSGFDEPTAVTDNGVIDTQPSVSAVNDGASVVWTTNNEGDILGIAGNNAIMRSDYDGTAWSAPYAVKPGLNAVVNITAGAVDGELCIAYVTDDDNDLNSITDRDIRMIKGEAEWQLTDDDVLDSNPMIENDMIYYYSDGNISYSDINGENAGTVFDETKPGLTDSFTVSSNDNGHILILWSKSEEVGSEIYASLYTDSSWSDEVKITEVGNKARYPSSVLANDGTMIVAFTNAIVEYNEIVRTDLYTLSVLPSYDIEITDAYFDDETMTAYATVKNNGELEIASYNVAIEGNNAKAISEPLKAGASVGIEIEYIKPENFSGRAIALTVSLDDGEEYNKNNNRTEFSIGLADIAVSDVAVNEDETTVSAKVSNIGYSDAENIRVQLRDGDMVIAERKLSLEPDTSDHIEFEVDKGVMGFLNSVKQLYVAAEYDGEEGALGNNDGYVYISSLSGSADYETAVLNYNEVDGKIVINSVAVNNTANDISCIMYTAVYSSDGKLKGCGLINTKIGAENDKGVDITVSCTIEETDVIKTFMWGETNKPLARTAEYTVE